MATAQVRYSAADRREQILEAATQLFARQGFQGTTTKQISDHTGVNEALIFRHFCLQGRTLLGSHRTQDQSCRAWGTYARTSKRGRQ